MSRRYSPSMIARSSSTVSLLWSKAVIPNASGADKVGVLAQGSHRQIRLFKGNKTATAADRGANAIEKQGCALHHTAAKHNGVRRKDRDQIRQPQPQVVRLSFARLQSQLIPLVREFANSLRGQVGAMRVIHLHPALDPPNHRRSSGERFPASVKTAQARWPGGVDDVMANFRVG